MGWKPVGFSEIEKFPSQVLAHHYPQVTNFGDMTKYKEWKLDDSIGLLVGGTPCQSFSVAGLRKGLDDPRGNLALTYVGILDKFRPKWCVWENVPGVLSSGRGRDFGAFLGALGELGYGWAYRVLDAQNFGVPQRRRRVFVVGCLGGWESAAKVLFESESLSGDFKQSRKKREETSNSFIPSVVGTLDTECGGGRKAHQSVMSGHFIPTFWNGGQTAETITCTSDDQRMPDKNRFQAVLQPIPIHAQATQYKGGGANRNNDGKGNGLGIGKPGDPMNTLDTSSRHAVACIGGQHPNAAIGEEISPTLTNAMGAGGGHVPVIGFDAYNSAVTGNVSKTLDTGSDYHHVPNVYSPTMAVRRLTEVECERLQGFPDNYTNIKENCPSGARYKALGNSMAVPVMRWIGERIKQYERL
jgi:DNA (cytosine-5)-methyltransferase 1